MTLSERDRRGLETVDLPHRPRLGQIPWWGTPSQGQAGISCQRSFYGNVDTRVGCEHVESKQPEGI